MPRLSQKKADKADKARKLAQLNRIERPAPRVLAEDSQAPPVISLDSSTESSSDEEELFSNWSPSPEPTSRENLYPSNINSDHWDSSDTDADDEGDSDEVQSIISLDDDYEAIKASVEGWKIIGFDGKTASEMREAVAKQFGSRSEGYGRRFETPKQTRFSRKKKAYNTFKSNGNLPLGELFLRQRQPSGSSSRPIRLSSSNQSSSSSAASDSENSGDSSFLPSFPSHYVIPYHLQDPDRRALEAEKAQLDKAYFEALVIRKKLEGIERKRGILHGWRIKLQEQVDRRHVRRPTQRDQENNRLLFWDGKLQMRRVVALIEFYRLLESGMGRGEASSIIAKVKGWGKYHGPRRLREMAREYEEDTNQLPTSARGNHSKVFSLLDDPDICEGMRRFVRQHKSRMNPALVMDYARETMIPAAVEKEKQLRRILPDALSKYVCQTLFPRIGYQPVKSIGHVTARRWLRREGFRYTPYTKGLYLDGHDREDVLAYRQEQFIPTLQRWRPLLVSYNSVNVSLQDAPTLEKPQNHVLLFHDESTFTANDGQRCSWVLNKSFDLRKKGAGRGIHRSDFICAPFGWLSAAGAQIAYGKAYEGYWTSDQLIDQLKTKLLPYLALAHPDHRFIIIFDNSSGHSAYASDALVASKRNLNDGGKNVEDMRDGWFDWRDGRRYRQVMQTPQGVKKGIRTILMERGLWPAGGLRGKCKLVTDHLPTGTCCAEKLLSIQPDFAAQLSAVAETVKAGGQEWLFLPKFHPELNIIENFWCEAKRYTREHCTYSYEGLKETIPVALQQIKISTIRRWEQRLWRRIEHYAAGASVLEVEEEEKKYKSHRRKLLKDLSAAEVGRG